MQEKTQIYAEGHESRITYNSLKLWDTDLGAMFPGLYIAVGETAGDGAHTPIKAICTDHIVLSPVTLMYDELPSCTCHSHHQRKLERYLAIFVTLSGQLRRYFPITHLRQPKNDKSLDNLFGSCHKEPGTFRLFWSSKHL